MPCLANTIPIACPAAANIASVTPQARIRGWYGGLSLSGCSTITQQTPIKVISIASQCRNVSSSPSQNQEKIAAIGGNSELTNSVSRGPISRQALNMQMSAKNSPNSPEIPSSNHVSGEASIGRISSHG